MDTTVRTDNENDAVNVENQPGKMYRDDSTKSISTTVRTDRGNAGDDPTETTYTTVIEHTKKAFK